jgi:hypothetical protein
MMKRLMVLGLVFALAAGIFLQAAVPVMADTPPPVTITLLSGNTTKTAGYAYDNPFYQTVTYVSGSSTETAGYTTANTSAHPLVASYYSGGGAWSPAQIITDTSPWVAIGGASWVSTTSAHGGVETANEGDAWRLFSANFTVSNPANVTSASIQIAADNAYEVYFNNNIIANTANWTPACTVYGPSHEPGGSTVPFNQVATYTLTPQTGTNTLMVVVRNWNNLGQGNPSGLAYKVTLTYSTINPLTPASYSGGGSWTNAFPITDLASPWVIPVAGAKWVSTTSENSGIENPNEGDSWRLFKDEFNIPAGATIDSAGIQIAADNAYEVYLNGSRIDTTANWTPACVVYGDSPEPGGSMIPFEQVTSYTLTPQPGINTLMFVVRNWGDGGGNPTGLMYAAWITYTPTPTTTPPATVGGMVFSVNKAQLLAPWLGALLGLLVLSLAVNRFVLRRRT